MLSGIGGCVLGVIFLGLGLFIRHRSQKGEELWRIGGGGLCHRKEPGCRWEEMKVPGETLGSDFAGYVTATEPWWSSFCDFCPCPPPSLSLFQKLPAMKMHRPSCVSFIHLGGGTT